MTMPNSERKLATRRARLGLPEELPGQGQLIPVTEDTCRWVELANEVGCSHEFSTFVSNPRARMSMDILHPGGGVLMRVEFMADGYWSFVTGILGATWICTHRSGEDEEVFRNCREDLRRCVYPHHMSQPDPPGWARELHEQAQERAAIEVAKQQAERYAQQTAYAESRAVAALIAAHKDEYEALMDAFRVEAALESRDA